MFSLWEDVQLVGKLPYQSTIALSTTEAKYMAVTEGVKEAIWLKGLLRKNSIYGGLVNVLK
jgi:hypothetical protein